MRRMFLFAYAMLSLLACQPPHPSPAIGDGSVQKGIASWYGGKFHGRPTASGEIFNMHALTAAHRSARFGTLATVTNHANQRSVTVRINDRGPFVDDRIIDVSLAAAKALGMLGTGTAEVTVRFKTQTVNGASPAASERYAYYLQIGSFRDNANADRLLKDLRQQFQEMSFILNQYVSRNVTYWRVRCGPFADPARAQSQARHFRNHPFFQQRQLQPRMAKEMHEPSS